MNTFAPRRSSSGTPLNRRLAGRADLTHAPETASSWRFDRICPDWTLDTTTEDSTALRGKVEALVGEWLS